MPTAQDVEREYHDASEEISNIVDEIKRLVEKTKQLADKHRVEFEIDMGERTYRYYPDDRYNDDGGWTSSQNC
jgi:hypothetical protein